MKRLWLILLALPLLSGCDGDTHANDVQACKDLADAVADRNVQCAEQQKGVTLNQDQYQLAYDRSYDSFVNAAVNGDCDKINSVRDSASLYDKCLPALRIFLQRLAGGKPAGRVPEATYPTEVIVFAGRVRAPRFPPVHSRRAPGREPDPASSSDRAVPSRRRRRFRRHPPGTSSNTGSYRSTAGSRPACTRSGRPPRTRSTAACSRSRWCSSCRRCAEPRRSPCTCRPRPARTRRCRTERPRTAVRRRLPARCRNPSRSPRNPFYRWSRSRRSSRCRIYHPRICTPVACIPRSRPGSWSRSRTLSPNRYRPRIARSGKPRSPAGTKSRSRLGHRCRCCKARADRRCRRCPLCRRPWCRPPARRRCPPCRFGRPYSPYPQSRCL